MIGLGSAGGEDHLRALFLGLRQQVFQLADLVSAQPDPGKVVPLDIDVGAEHRADIFQPRMGVGKTPKRTFGCC